MNVSNFNGFYRCWLKIYLSKNTYSGITNIWYRLNCYVQRFVLLKLYPGIGMVYD